MPDRERVGRAVSPSAAVVANQSVKTVEAGSRCGYDSGKKSKAASGMRWSMLMGIL